MYIQTCGGGEVKFEKIVLSIIYFQSIGKVSIWPLQMKVSCWEEGQSLSSLVLACANPRNCVEKRTVCGDLDFISQRLAQFPLLDIYCHSPLKKMIFSNGKAESTKVMENSSFGDNKL